ncbi:acyltransferase [Mycolicibacterium sarraceniae]|uniref:Acyltransferase n=2 Tax=Mycolicibacterium sarraceniae TaxID=1534348 RepID=A0A7I7SU37_9MYCO|nr:acyltransferase [Mycolicibacterium sarraceniae]
MRAIAVLVVVAFHAGLPLPGGFVGVDIFFVISGFVITAMLHRHLQQSGRIKFGDFYLRRFKRLTPALALMIAVTMMLSAAFVSPLGPQQTAGQTAVGAMALVANIVIATTAGGYFNAKADTNPLLHTWSLSVEEQFYLVFPMLILLGWVLARSRRRFMTLSPLLIVAASGAVSFTLAVVSSHGVSVPGFQRILGFYGPVTRVWEFAAGALLALMLARWAPASTRLCQVLSIIGLAIVIGSVLVINDRTPFPGTWTLLPVTGTLLLILSGTRATGPAFRLLAARAMVKVGDWSYSVYLWHWPFIVVAGLLLPHDPWALFGAAVLSCAPAMFSYRYVEEPIRKLEGLNRRHWIGLVATVLVIPMLLGGSLWFSASRGWWSQPVRHLQAATIPLHTATIAGCDERQPLDPAVKSHCTWGSDAAGSPIYLVGDSNSTQFSEGIIAAGRHLGRQVVVAAAVACPMVDIYLDTPPPSDKAVCRRYVEGTLDYLKRSEPGVVVIANTDQYWHSSIFKAGNSIEALSTESSRKVAALRIGLLRTVETLMSAGQKVLLIQTIPHLNWDPSRCNLFDVIEKRCATETTLEAAITPVLATRSVLKEVAHDTGAAIWDPAAALCPAQVCSTEAPNFVRYRDSAHISVPQSAALAPDLQAAIASAGEYAAGASDLSH